MYGNDAMSNVQSDSVLKNYFANHKTQQLIDYWLKSNNTTKHIM